MAVWVKCTDVSDRTIFLNLEHAISMVPLERTQLTRVTFIGAEKDTVEVKETPGYLIKIVEDSRG